MISVQTAAPVMKCHNLICCCTLVTDPISYCLFCLTISVGKRKLSPSAERVAVASSIQYEDVEPRALPQLNLTQPSTLPPFEKRRGGGTGNNVVLEENPAYQSLDAQTTTETDESLYL